MDQEDLEEGEITDSDEETSEINAASGTADAPATEYSLLPRPTNPAMSYRVPQESQGLPAAQSFRESPAGAGGDDSEDDDSDQALSEKRAKLAPDVPPKEPAAKKRSVWADVLLEQHISSKIKSGGLTEDPDTVERGVESYRPSGESRMAAIDEFEGTPEAAPGELWNVNEDGESLETGRKKSSKKKKKKKHSKIHERIDYDYDAAGFDDYDDYLPDEVCPEDDERVIARYIARNLNEPKVILIERVTRFAGRRKALELFNATMDIEAAGGMMTLQGTTRRTPGGVFLQLLKKDKGISKDTVKDIFAVERENQKFAKKVHIKDRQARKRKYYNKGTNQGTNDQSETASSTSHMDASEELDMLEEPDIEIGVAS